MSGLGSSLLCGDDVVQPGGQDAVEKRVDKQHDEAAGDWQAGHLGREWLDWRATPTSVDQRTSQLTGTPVISNLRIWIRQADME